MPESPEYDAMVLLHAAQDLRRLSLSENPFDQLTAAAVTRKLLLDDHPIVHQVNSGHRVRLRFPVAAYDVPWPASLPRPDLHIENVVFPGDCPPHWTVQQVTENQFLSRRMGQVGDEAFTIKDLVKYLANCRGGVHLGGPDASCAELHAALTGMAQQSLQLSSVAATLIAEGSSHAEDIADAYAFLAAFFAHNGLVAVRDGMRSISRCVIVALDPLIERLR